MNELQYSEYIRPIMVAFDNRCAELKWRLNFKCKDLNPRRDTAVVLFPGERGAHTVNITSPNCTMSIQILFYSPDEEFDKLSKYSNTLRVSGNFKELHVRDGYNDPIVVLESTCTEEKFFQLDIVHNFGFSYEDLMQYFNGDVWLETPEPSNTRKRGFTMNYSGSLSEVQRVIETYREEIIEYINWVDLTK